MYCLIQMSSLSRFSSHLMADFVAKKIIQTLRHHIRRLYRYPNSNKKLYFILVLRTKQSICFLFFISLFYKWNATRFWFFACAALKSYHVVLSPFLVMIDISLQNFWLAIIPCLCNCLYVCVFRQTFHIKYRYTKCDDKQYRLSIPFR